MRQVHLSIEELAERQTALRDYLAAHPAATSIEIAAATGVPRTSVRRFLAKTGAQDGGETTGPAVAVPARPAPRAGVSRAAFAARFDVVTRTREAVRTGVATLTNDDEILTDSEFRARCPGASANVWRQVTSEDEFAGNRFRVGDGIHWATRATVRWALAEVSRAVPA